MANQADRRNGLGWWLAGALVVFMSLSYEAGALDLDREISRYDQSSSEILGTLRSSPRHLKTPAKDLPSLDEEDLVEDYKVELIPVQRDKSS